MSFDSTTLKAGSRVLTVWVSEMATAAKDRLAAMCPNACMEAGPNRVLNSAPVIGCSIGASGQLLALMWDVVLALT